LQDTLALETLPAAELLNWAVDRFGKGFAISTSFQKEGMVLIDMASRLGKPVRVLTIDTGRLPEETYRMMETVRTRYGLAVEVIVPDSREVEAMVNRLGPNLFYSDAAYRRLCCHFRKVRPLEARLKGLQAWASGLRREQSDTRAGTAKVESGEPMKLNPLADWSGVEVERYIAANDVPLHPLYAKGYTSIGCAPCTRAIEAGETERAGRWWWEQDSNKECGIHFGADGKISRRLDVLIDEILQARNA
jgi:thioredoxin-dependent adenylylsulfate APS reductase